MTEQQVLLQRQEKEQKDKVTACVPDKKRLAELEKQVKHLKKGKKCAVRIFTHFSVIMNVGARVTNTWQSPEL